MKRYLVTFLTEGQFAVVPVIATTVSSAITVFLDHNIAHEEIISVVLCC